MRTSKLLWGPLLVIVAACGPDWTLHPTTPDPFAPVLTGGGSAAPRPAAPGPVIPPVGVSVGGPAPGPTPAEPAAACRDAFTWDGQACVCKPGTIQAGEGCVIACVPSCAGKRCGESDGCSGVCVDDELCPARSCNDGKYWNGNDCVCKPGFVPTHHVHEDKCVRACDCDADHRKRDGRDECDEDSD